MSERKVSDKWKMKDNEADEIIEMIMQILNCGNTAEVKRRKDDIIVLEVKRTIKQSM